MMADAISDDSEDDGWHDYNMLQPSSNANGSHFNLTQCRQSPVSRREVDSHSCHQSILKNKHNDHDRDTSSMNLLHTQQTDTSVCIESKTTGKKQNPKMAKSKLLLSGGTSKTNSAIDSKENHG